MLTINHLPDEILLEIVSYLPAEQRFLLSGCSKKFYRVARDDVDFLVKKGVALPSMLSFSIESRPNDTTLSQFILDSHLHMNKKKEEEKGKLETLFTNTIKNFYNTAVFNNSSKHILWINEKFVVSFLVYLEWNTDLELFVGRKKLVDEIVQHYFPSPDTIAKHFKLFTRMLISGSEVAWNMIKDNISLPFISHTSSLYCLRSLLISAISSGNVHHFKYLLSFIEDNKQLKKDVLDRLHSSDQEVISSNERGNEEIMHDIVHNIISFGNLNNHEICLISSIGTGNEEMYDLVSEFLSFGGSPEIIIPIEKLKMVVRNVDNSSFISKLISRFSNPKRFLLASLSVGNLDIAEKILTYQRVDNDGDHKKENIQSYILYSLESGKKEVLEWTMKNFFRKDLGDKIDIDLIFPALRHKVRDTEIIRMLCRYDEHFEKKILKQIPTIQCEALKGGDVHFALILGREMKISTENTFYTMCSTNFIVDIINGNKNGIEIVEEFFGREFLMGSIPNMITFYRKMITIRDEETLRRCIWFGKKYGAPPIMSDHLSCILTRKKTRFIGKRDRWGEIILEKVHSGLIPFGCGFSDFYTTTFYYNYWYPLFNDYGYKLMGDHKTHKLVKMNVVEGFIRGMINFFI